MGIALTVDSLDDLLGRCFEKLFEHGEDVAATRGPSIELRGVSLELTNPRARLSRSASRGRLFSALGELTWYLSGTNDPEHIAYYIRDYGTRVGDYGGAYGPRLFGDGHDAQVERVIEQLRLKPTTRQAVVQIFDRSDLEGSAKDVPCTCTLQFFVRQSRVDLVVYMRSNDVVFGLPHDVFTFTFLQELIARTLECDVGTYTHMVGSLHLYRGDEKLVRSFLKEGALISTPMPVMPPGDPWPMIEHMRATEQTLRNGGSVDAELGTARYWEELEEVLVGFQAVKAKDSGALRQIRERLAGSFYDIYLSDKHFALEGAVDA